jgi:hypothetical protein
VLDLRERWTPLISEDRFNLAFLVSSMAGVLDLVAETTADGEDKCWRIDRGVDSSEVRDDAAHDLLTYGVPWLRERVV